MKSACIKSFLLAAAFNLSLAAAERPYFVTYDHHMEEPGNLEVSVNPLLGTQKAGNGFVGTWMEFEYGAKGWWTTEFYLDGQTTQRDGTVFTGFRWENRVRPLMREHRINPVLYVEFESLNGADKTLKEVVGFDSQGDHALANAEARREKKHELESKLILGSQFRGWNISENFIAEKNLRNEPWEFGYAIGTSRPLRLAATPRPCNFCRENFQAGIEFYGGLGDWHRFTAHGTSQYVAPVLSWALPNGTALRFSPGFGLTSASHKALFRFGISYELPGFGHQVRRLFR